MLTKCWLRSDLFIDLSWTVDEDNIRLYLVPSKVWNQNGRNPYITFEYTVLRDALPPVSQPPLYTGPDARGNGDVSVEVGRVLSQNETAYDSVGLEGEPNRMLRPGPETGGAEGQKISGQVSNEVYTETAGVDCEDGALATPQQPGVSGEHT